MGTQLRPFKSQSGFWSIFVVIILAFVVIFIIGVGRDQIVGYVNNLFNSSNKISKAWVTNQSTVINISYKYPPEWHVSEENGDLSATKTNVNLGSRSSSADGTAWVDFIESYDGAKPTGTDGGTVSVNVAGNSISLTKYLSPGLVTLFGQDSSHNLTIKALHADTDINAEGTIENIISTLQYTTP